jgi:hypothetical protein
MEGNVPKDRKVVGKYGLTIDFYNDGSVEVKVDGKTNDMRVVSVLEIEKMRFVNNMMRQARKGPGPPGFPAGGKTGGQA